jgi:hypothetical protein
VAVIPHCWATDILVAATAHVLATLKSAPYLEVNATRNPLRTDLLTQADPGGGRPCRRAGGAGPRIELDEATIERYRWVP